MPVEVSNVVATLDQAYVDDVNKYNNVHDPLTYKMVIKYTRLRILHRSVRPRYALGTTKIFSCSLSHNCRRASTASNPLEGEISASLGCDVVNPSVI